MPCKAILLFMLHFCIRKAIFTESFGFGMVVGEVNENLDSLLFGGYEAFIDAFGGKLQILD